MLTRLPSDPPTPAAADVPEPFSEDNGWIVYEGARLGTFPVANASSVVGMLNTAYRMGVNRERHERAMAEFDR